jgi:aminopeptidase N
MTRLVRPLLALAACLVAAAAPAVEITPLAPPQPGQPWTREHQVGQTRAFEAGMKARFAEKALAAAAAPKAGQEGWDVIFYDLVMDLDPAAGLLVGTGATEAVVTTDGLAALDLDLAANMAVTAVRAGGAAAAWTRAGDVLQVTLDRAYAAGETVRVEVDYQGNPAGDYFGWDSYGGQPVIWTLSEPYGARHWWPCKDVNTDKADSVALHVTVPDPLVVAGNGVLEAQTAPAPGRTTYHWTTRYPIATYLVSVTAHPYEVRSDVYTALDGSTMPVDNYMFPAWADAGEAGYAVVVDQLAAFAAAFGEYPFVEEKYGHAHFLWGGGMEHQTCSSMVYSYYQSWFLAHELGHQWFGDLITCADFHHIWLNEGFATWCEAYWREVSEGAAGYRAEMNAARYFGGGTIYVEDATDFNAIFDYYLTYNKSSWVVHMLRGVMGDEDFFAALLRYRSEYGFDAADTEEFRAVMEAESGLDLGPFFQQWIYGAYYPEYDVAWTAEPTADGSRVRVRVSQVQTQAGLFTMPLEIRVTDAQGGRTDVRVDNALQTEWYVIDVPGTAVQVELDPDDWVLCAKTVGGASGVPEAAATALLGAAPNPFNPRTEIRWAQAAAGPVSVAVHDAAGRRVRVLVDEVRPGGEHAVAWDGRDEAGRRAAAGTYLVRLEAAGAADVRKITLVK